MLCLGLEGTAHTLGVGVVDEKGTVMANVIRMYRPEAGGIHPREAANHHAEVLPLAIQEALEIAGVTPNNIELIAFSQGPGLGPCLRTAATAARALSLQLDIPLIGVNHCVAHLEIGRLLGCTDPVLLYASGANTQVIAFINGKYRVFGETQDIGLGNMLDKFGRTLELPFPAGPRIEELALEGKHLLELPYSVKGMDVAFSGILTAAISQVEKGAKLPDICHSLQETCFAMLVEVTERAMAHTDKSEVLLGGGVVRNQRLFEMTATMANERGTEVFRPVGGLCVDNGAMIAWTGILMHNAGLETSIEDSGVNQKFRTDEVDVVWRNEETCNIVAKSNLEPQSMGSPTRGNNDHGFPKQGAEATLNLTRHYGVQAVSKARVPKGYRDKSLDTTIRKQRTKMEAKLLSRARCLGVPTPVVLDIDPLESIIMIEHLHGVPLKCVLDEWSQGFRRERLAEVGAVVARLHDGGIVHGDLTTSNLMWVPANKNDEKSHRDVKGSNPEGKVALLDFGLASMDDQPEAQGVDLHLLEEAFKSAHVQHIQDLDAAFESYLDTRKDPVAAKKALDKMKEIESRGRYA